MLNEAEEEKEETHKFKVLLCDSQQIEDSLCLYRQSLFHQLLQIASSVYFMLLGLAGLH
jgi:hypothetical protein